MIRIVSLPDDLKDIRNSDNLYRFDLKGDDFPFNTFDYYVDMKIVAFGAGENRTILKDNKEYLQQRIDKAIDKLKSMLPMCIMPNNMLIHGTEKARIIEETVNILEGEDNE